MRKRGASGLVLLAGLAGLTGCGGERLPDSEGYLTPETPVEAAAGVGGVDGGGGGAAGLAPGFAETAAAEPLPSVSPDAYVGQAPSGPRDKYQTDPIPAGKPQPVEPEDAAVDPGRNGTATLSISAETILSHMDQFDKGKLSVLPPDGVILAGANVSLSEGESVFDVLKRETRDRGIHMEFSWFPIYNSVYIEGINNLYEFDCGDLSGWMYKVNGWFPNYGASRYAVQDGDVIDWVYTCDLGRDIGGWYPGLELP
ncbi:MAG: DUF4430 domain-containing protein [Bifidobacteriaceae bacterium]|jgi:hypothetical protein|nr:DUF4430 domain-containing protein [Bifidobacteriaceae bacterium]